MDWDAEVRSLYGISYEKEHRRNPIDRDLFDALVHESGACARMGPVSSQFHDVRLRSDRVE